MILGRRESESSKKIASHQLSLVLIIALSLFSAILPNITLAHEGHDDAGVTTTITRIRGRVTVGISDDYKNKKADVIYQIEEEGTGRIYNIHFKDRAPRTLKTGAVVNLRGRVMQPSGDDTPGEILLGTGRDGTSAEVVSAATAAAVSGNQSTLVMLLKFNDASVSCSKSQVENLMWSPTSNNTVDSLYRDTSRSAVSFSGIVEADLAVPLAISGTCNYNSWASEGDKAATARGINLANYPRRIYVFPAGHNCGWAGLGTLGGSPSRSWIAGGYCGHTGVYAHELGHNLTMHHAATPTSEYGDNSDVMGGAGTLKRMNAPHLVQMGWIPSTKVSTVGVGNHEIASVSSDPVSTGLAQVLKVSRPSANDHYYLSWRSAVGMDANLSSTFLNRLSVHTYSSGMAKTYLIQTLGQGESFVDSVNGVRFRVDSIGSSSMRIAIEGECTRNAPTMTIQSIVNIGLNAKSSLTFSLKNNDSPFCPGSDFNLSSMISDPGFKVSLPAAAAMLSPGQSISLNAEVEHVSALASATLEISATDVSLSRTVRSASMINLDNIAPTTPNGLTATIAKNKQVKLAWLASTDASGIAKYQIYRNGVLITETTILSYTDTGASGTVTYQVFAIDRAGNKSLGSNQVSVSISSGTGGGGKGKPTR